VEARDAFGDTLGLGKDLSKINIH
jgi:hypothetical protein